MFTRSKVRALVRAVVVVATAWGFDFSAEQVAAIQVAVEAVLQVVFKDEK
jgi:hypothetical protein